MQSADISLPPHCVMPWSADEGVSSLKNAICACRPQRCLDMPRLVVHPRRLVKGASPVPQSDVAARCTGARCRDCRRAVVSTSARAVVSTSARAV
eukprot:4612860-Pleurochrysis_carterae.AAC.1